MMMLMVVQKGHGIPDSLLKEIKSVAHNFFDLPNEEKVKIKIFLQRDTGLLHGITSYIYVYCND